MTYGDRLLEAMNKAHMTRKQLAGAIDCSVQIIGMVITGGGKAERKLSADNHSKAARILSVDPEWLSSGESTHQCAVVPRTVHKPEPSVEATRLALLFDLLPRDDFLNREVVYQACTQVIIQALRAIESSPIAVQTEPVST